MSDVFISYAREDRDSAKRLAEAIEQRGWTVWWDRRIPAGESYEDAIEQAIADAACVVVLWTGTSIASKWVRNEAAEGMSREVLIPIRLEDVRPPMAFRHLQNDDLFGWTSAEIENCLDSIESMIGAPSKAAIPRPVPPPPENKTPTPPPPRSSSSSRKPLRIFIAVVIGAAIVIVIVSSLMNSKKAEIDTAATDTSIATTDTATTSTTSTETTGTTMDPTVPREPVAVFTPSAADTSTGVATNDVLVTAEVVDFQTSAGTFTVEFFPKAVPNHVHSILAAVRSGDFDRTSINYIDGDGVAVGPSSPKVPFESNNVAFVRGTLVNVNINDKGQDSSAEFFINTRAMNFDRKTCAAFGRVIAGMDVVDSIAKLPVDKDHRPLKPFNIQRAIVRQRNAQGL